MPRSEDRDLEQPRRTRNDGFASNMGYFAADMRPALPDAIVITITQGVDMCVTCGCGIPEDKHGDDRNITLSEVQAAAEAAEISIDDAVANLNKGVVDAKQN